MVNFLEVIKNALALILQGFEAHKIYPLGTRFSDHVYQKKWFLCHVQFPFWSHKILTCG